MKDRDRLLEERREAQRRELQRAMEAKQQKLIDDLLEQWANWRQKHGA